MALIFTQILLFHDKLYNCPSSRTEKQSYTLRCVFTDNLLPVRLKQIEVSLYVLFQHCGN